MAENENKAMTEAGSNFDRSNNNRTIQTGGAENKRDDSGDQKVSVKALSVFHKEEHMKGDMCKPGDEFEVSRSRAAQLRANGLVEYSNDSDGKGESEHHNEAAKRRQEQSKIPENSKGTPLRNPEIKLAEAPAKDAKGDQRNK